MTLKILCEYSHGGSVHVRSGWGRAFTSAGLEFTFWNPEEKSAFDAFSETEPDVFLGTTYGVDRAVFKNIEQRPKMKVAMFGSAWGPMTDRIDKKKFPIVVVSEEEKKTIAKLRERTGKPNFVFIHSHGKWLEDTMSGWSQIGVRQVGVLNAFDTILYANPEFREDLKCDVGFCGARWPYKAINLDPFIFPMCHSSSGLNVKIFGRHGWPVGQFLGTCTDQESRDLFVSATVCPNISEPHSTELGFDFVERPYKVLGCGGFCVSDHVDEGRDLFEKDEIPMARTPEEMLGIIEYFVRNPDERHGYIKRGREKVLKNHTYHHRASQILSELSLFPEARSVLEQL